MSSRAIRTVWSFLGVLAFGFALTSTLRTTGHDVSDHLLPLGSAEPYSAALVSWPLLAALLASLLHVTALYMRQPDVAGCRQWEARLPVFYFDTPDVDPQSRLGARYQRVVFVAFIVLPLLLQAVLLVKIAGGTVFEPAGGRPFATSLREQFWPAQPVDWQAARSGLYRFGSPETGVTYYPLLTPYGYAIGELLLIVYAAVVCSRLMANRTTEQPKSAAAPPL